MDEALKTAGILTISCMILCIVVFGSMAIGSEFGPVGSLIGLFGGTFIGSYTVFKFIDWVVY